MEAELREVGDEPGLRGGDPEVGEEGEAEPPTDRGTRTAATTGERPGNSRAASRYSSDTTPSGLAGPPDSVRAAALAS